MKYQLVIFDFDGTLADTFSWFLTIADDLADQFHLKRIDRSQIETMRGLDMKKILQHHDVPLWMLPQLAAHIQGLLARDIHKVQLFEGIEQILQELSGQGTRLAVVSSNSYKNISQVLGPENTARFDYFECGVSLYGKTSRLKRVLKKSGILSSNTLSIGDEIRDLEAARQVNIPFGAVSWGYTAIQALTGHSPEWVFNQVNDMLALLA